MMIGVPLALSSWWGLAVLALILPVLIWRILDEEKLLKNDLPGYRQLPKSYNYHMLSSAIWNGLKASHTLAHRRVSCYTLVHEERCSLKEGLCATAVLTSP